MRSMVEKASMRNTIKKGDLVEFHSSFESFMRDYEHRNPGIVLAVKKTLSLGVNRESAKVMWKDNSVTSEHSTYLRRITK